MAMMPVDTARATILEWRQTADHRNRYHSTRHCGRVLATPVKAKRDQPPFAASAMDGYAVKHADVDSTARNTQNHWYKRCWSWV